MYVNVRKYYITRIEEIYEIRLDRKEALQFQKKVVKEVKSKASTLSK